MVISLEATFPKPIVEKLSCVGIAVTISQSP
jgi:hypothetical protein